MFAVFRDQQGASVAGADCVKQRVVRCEGRAVGRGLVGRQGIFAVSPSDTGTTRGFRTRGDMALLNF